MQRRRKHISMAIRSAYAALLVLQERILRPAFRHPLPRLGQVFPCQGGDSQLDRLIFSVFQGVRGDAVDQFLISKGPALAGQPDGIPPADHLLRLAGGLLTFNGYGQLFVSSLRPDILHRLINGSGRGLVQQGTIQPSIIDRIAPDGKMVAVPDGRFSLRRTLEIHMPAASEVGDGAVQNQLPVLIVRDAYILQPIEPLVIRIVHPVGDGIAYHAAHGLLPVGDQDLIILMHRAVTRRKITHPVRKRRGLRLLGKCRCRHADRAYCSARSSKELLQKCFPFFPFFHSHDESPF